MDVPNTDTTMDFGMESLGLQMLSEVASAMLKTDPSVTETIHPKKIKSSKTHGNRKNSHSDKLTLDQIKALSDKMLIEMFSEFICDEMKRKYSFTCFLMPDKCSITFKSFGSEERARCKMKSHLQSHLNDLSSEYTDNIDEPFTAEPLHVRQKRLREISGKYQRKKKKGKPPNTKKRNDSSEDKNKSSDMNSFNFASRNIAFENSYNSTNTPQNDLSMFGVTKAYQNDETVSNMHFPVYYENGNIKQEIEQEIEHINTYYDNQTVNLSTDPSTVNQHASKKSKKKSKVASCTQASYTVKWDTDLDEVNLSNSSHLSSSEIKPFLHTSVNILHDHTYTSLQGNTFYDASSEYKNNHALPLKDEDNTEIFTTFTKPLVIPTPPFPYIYSPMLPYIAEIKEVEVNSNFGCSSSVNEEKRQETVAALPIKQLFEKDGKDLDYSEYLPSEEDDAITEDDENTQSDSYWDDIASDIESDGSTLIVDKEVFETNCPASLQSVEKKLALKLIRALRTKKKDERGPLTCQICKNKSFTAHATLMYHYRSHAGIKPFSCSVCDATFTRQHSLNYHKLIHDNKSRFECTDCGRMFRHPSHYREHLRRHTGETPYECIVCNLRFKTRNTYKRHLKTRHGKVLSAQGIEELPVEEFYTVKTSPKPEAKKSPERQESETRWSEILFSEDFYP